MAEILYFYSKEKMSKKALESFLIAEFVWNNFVYLTDFYEFAAENDIDRNTVYISHQSGNAGFRNLYCIYADTDEIPIKKRVELLKELAAISKIELITGDDEIAPFSMVLISPDKVACTVDCGMEDDLDPVGYYNFSLGSFCCKMPLSEKEMSLLHALLCIIFKEFSINVSNEGPVVNGEFENAKKRIKQLNQFDYHYEISPEEKTDWLDREEKSTRFTALMQEFQKAVQKELCLFPPNFIEVKNIPGGSDSEEYCLLLGNMGMEKIVYKQRREKW
jgi:hypothetical protein